MSKVCPVIIERNITSFICDLELDHDGPHMAHGDAKSMRERAEWVDGPQESEPLSAFQGEPQTTAERYTENPTDHPAVVKAQEEDSAREWVKNLSLLKLTDPDAKVCRPCFEGRHLQCVHRAELISVRYYDKDQMEEWCSCFQQDPVAHGMGEDTGGASPTPGPGKPEVREVLETLAKSSTPPLGFGTHGSDGKPYNSEPTKQRPGDQVLPRPTGEKSVQERIISKANRIHEQGEMTDQELGFVKASMEESIKVGQERYGTPLQAFNGRSTLQDLEDELRDSFVYVSSLNQASTASREDVIGLCEDAVKAANERGESMGLTQVVTIVVDTILGAVGTLSNIKVD